MPCDAYMGQFLGDFQPRLMSSANGRIIVPSIYHHWHGLPTHMLNWGVKLLLSLIEKCFFFFVFQLILTKLRQSFDEVEKKYFLGLLFLHYMASFHLRKFLKSACFTLTNKGRCYRIFDCFVSLQLVWILIYSSFFIKIKTKEGVSGEGSGNFEFPLKRGFA